MRLFYAVEFDESVKDELAKVQSILREKAQRANFTRKENFHLTLRFMGEIEDANYIVLTKIQEEIASKYDPFLLELTKPGIFKRGNKFIVWWGICENEKLNMLQKSLEEEIRLNGFPAEYKTYNPHITLAREFSSYENVKEILGGLGSLSNTIYVGSISLMESLHKDGKLTYLCRNKTKIDTCGRHFNE